MKSAWLVPVLILLPNLGHATQRPDVSPPIQPIVDKLRVDPATMVRLTAPQKEVARQAGLRLISLCPDCRLATVADEGPCGWARSQRLIIERAAARGDSADSIVAAYVSVYGPNVLALEATNPARRASWMIPYALGGLGLLVLLGVARRLRRTDGEASEIEVAPSLGIRSILDEELEALD